MGAVEAVLGDVYIEAMSELLVMFFILQDDSIITTLEFFSKSFYKVSTFIISL